MCLSTAYLNEKQADKIAASYVSSIKVEGGVITLTDVVGFETVIRGTIDSIDLTGGVVIIKADVA